MTGTPSAKAGAPFRGSSDDPSPVPREDSFNGVLYSLKAFSVATTLVIAGGAASLWGVKVYLGVKDVREYIHLLIMFHLFLVLRTLRAICHLRRRSLHPPCA